MHLNIVLNSGWLLLLGLGVMLGGAVTALLLETWWPLLLLPMGVLFAFRLEKDPASVRLAELVQRGNCNVKRYDKQLFGVAGDFFVVGPLGILTVEAIESLLEPTDPFQSNAVVSPTSSFALTSLASMPAGMSVWRLQDIERVTFASTGNSFTLVQDGKELLQQYRFMATRDAVLKSLEDALPWQIDKQTRKEFQIDVISSIVCLSIMFLSMALVFTALGVVQPNQLPLGRWNDINNVRGGGKGRGALLIWVALCEGYLFLVDNLHPSAMLLLGGAITVALGILLYASQWTKVTDTTWRHPKATV